MPYPEKEQDSYRLMAIFRPLRLSVYLYCVIGLIVVKFELIKYDAATKVWLGLGFAIVCLIAFISFCQRYHDRNSFERTLIDIIHRRSLYVFGIFCGCNAYGKKITKT